MISGVRGQGSGDSISFRNLIYALWRDRAAGLALRVGLLLSFILVLMVATFYWRLPPEIPLNYSRPWGVAQLVPTEFLFALMALVAVLFSINTSFSAVFIHSEKLLAQILAWTNALVVFVVDVAVWRVVMLVT